MQSLEELAKVYQDLLRQRYPDIIVCLDPDAADEFPGGMFAAFGISDTREEEYSQYLYGEFPALLVSRGIEFINIVIHTDSVAQQYYPTIWQQVCEGRRALDEKRVMANSSKKKRKTPLVHA